MGSGGGVLRVAAEFTLREQFIPGTVQLSGVLHQVIAVCAHHHIRGNAKTHFNISGTLGRETNVTTKLYNNFDLTTLKLDNDRQSVSGVDLNEEATSMMLVGLHGLEHLYRTGSPVLGDGDIGGGNVDRGAAAKALVR